MISTENSVIVNHDFYFEVDKYVGPISAAKRAKFWEKIIKDENQYPGACYTRGVKTRTIIMHSNSLLFNLDYSLKSLRLFTERKYYENCSIS